MNGIFVAKFRNINGTSDVWTWTVWTNTFQLLLLLTTISFDGSIKRWFKPKIIWENVSKIAPLFRRVSVEFKRLAQLTIATINARDIELNEQFSTITKINKQQIPSSIQICISSHARRLIKLCLMLWVDPNASIFHWHINLYSGIKPHRHTRASPVQSAIFTYSARELDKQHPKIGWNANENNNGK